MQEKPPPGRTTCPSCSNRCADGGQTGLRVHLVFALRGGGGRPPAAVCQGWKLDRGGGSKATEPDLSVLSLMESSRKHWPKPRALRVKPAAARECRRQGGKRNEALLSRRAVRVRLCCA